MEPRTDVKHILDKSFHYRRSHETDIRKTFERVRRDMRQQQQAREQAEKKVVQLALSTKR
jgi:hypothetical protein